MTRSVFCGLAIAVFTITTASTQELPAVPVSSPNAEHIVQQVMERNGQRAAALKGYSGRRVYQLQYSGFFGKREAELVVEVDYEAPASKRFSIVSQSGSKLLVDKVFKKLLTSEEEALTEENRRQTEISPANYEFRLEGEETTEAGHFYVLKLEPKSRKKFLYRGTIWVDAHDFAIARIVAEPAKNPSFWTSKAEIEHMYKKVGGFWLPAQNRSTSRVRFGGSARLTIDYVDYQLQEESEPAVISENKAR
jgi:outer membrane lipoprotein-sorting protein